MSPVAPHRPPPGRARRTGRGGLVPRTSPCPSWWPLRSPITALSPCALCPRRGRRGFWIAAPASRGRAAPKHRLGSTPGPPMDARAARHAGEREPAGSGPISIPIPIQPIGLSTRAQAPRNARARGSPPGPPSISAIRSSYSRTQVSGFTLRFWLPLPRPGPTSRSHRSTRWPPPRLGAPALRLLFPDINPLQFGRKYLASSLLRSKSNYRLFGRFPVLFAEIRPIFA
jgi:hypothetical protein